MEIRDLQNAGSDVLNAVSNAVESGDYSNLAQSIKDSFSAVTGTVPTGKKTTYTKTKTTTQTTRTSFGQGGTHSYNETLKGRSAQWTRPEDLRTYSQNTRGANKSARYAGANVVKRNGAGLPATPYFKQGLVFSQYSGLPYLIGGGIGTALTGMSAFTFLTLGAFLAPLRAGFLTGAGLFGAGLVATALLLRNGIKKNALYKRYAQYGKALADADYMAIEDISKLTGFTKEQIVKDIKDCQKQGYLPLARFDKNETTLMVTERAYAQYTAAEQSRLSREQSERELQDKVAGSMYAAQVEQILKDGDEYLKTVKELNAKIPDPEMSAKISRVEDLMNKTFEEVRKQPQTAPSLRKYMSYYLPTTVKLLNAYADLNERPEIGTNITQTKREIENSLDMVGDGFEKLFDSLFEDISMDIASDISVMKTMMAQDGLTEDTVTIKATDHNVVG